jgi:GAF domain-containing protein
MKAPPIPANEAQRLEALRQLLILDTAPEERFDRIVAFASQEFGVPTCLITFVDEHRQWFKARVGWAATESSREISFCGHAVAQPEHILVVEDAHADERFHDNPLVTGDTQIRFYAGAPLTMEDGSALGTLCLIDQQPRQLDPLDLAMLGALRDLVCQELAGVTREETQRQGVPADRTVDAPDSRLDPTPNAIPNATMEPKP